LLLTAIDNNWHEDIPLLVKAGLSINTREISKYLYRGSAKYRELVSSFYLNIY
jgi:hypothetical protein